MKPPRSPRTGPALRPHPMFWNGRVYFLSDRDGVMNLYSMDAKGHGVKEESHQHIFDIESASIDDGRIVYACGSDLWLLDSQAGHEEVIPITLASDFDQMREHWVKKPLDYLTAVHISPDGSSAVFTARGEIFTLPAKTGRIVKVAGDSGVRYREARFLPDGKSIVALSTAKRRNRILEIPRQRRPAARAVDQRRACAALGRRSLARRPLAGPSRQGSAALDLRHQGQNRQAHRAVDDGRLRRSQLVGRQPLARLFRTGDNQFHQIKILNSGVGSNPDHHLRPLQQRESQSGARTANGSTSSPTAI